ncbi:MAG: filamentous hemagglutinin N-terminal domain-containing protein [Spirirestis rafaelensis WJT71-NPBG6]|jgi:filamentous hemagglutinin family protein|nr:filamentous hemagglutinin N-terminal domain-containing protein [Spirirestis rafaelensis WJT71-NPBG6]
MVNNWKRLGLSVLLAIGGAIATATKCAAQNITLDGTLGPAGPLTGPNYTIREADGLTVNNNNLFQSFGRFNLNAGETANFQSGVNIRNIFSRVTGGSTSFIDGLIRTQSGNVNLFFINPSGIIFGSNARLDVRGSFIATTADALVWANNSQFSATNPGNANSLLTIVGDPSGFLSTVNQPRPIDVQGSTLNNRQLLLVGGDIKVDGGTLQAAGGRVDLGGLAQSGTIGLQVTGNNLSLNFTENLARASVSLTNGSNVSVASGGGGSIAINASDIDILGGSNLRAGINRLPGTDNAQAGDVNLKATGTLRIENSSVYNAAFGRGNAGNLRVDTGKLIVRDGVLATATVSGGRSGDLIVKASDSVELTGSPTSNGTVPINIPVVITDTIFGFPVDFLVDFPVDIPIGLFSASIDVRNLVNVGSEFNAFLPRSGGDAGNLTINTGQLTVSNGAAVSAGTTTTGRAGNLTVKAKDFIELSGTSLNDAPPGLFTIGSRVPSGLRNETAGRGLGGNLTINTGRLIVRDGAWVTTGTGGRMPGGELTVNAWESVDLSGISEANNLPSVLSSGTQGAGDAKPLTINTGRLSVRDGGIISAGTSGDGQGADLTINARNVELIGTSRQGLSANLLNQLIGVAGTRVFGIVENSPYPSGIITGSAGNGSAGDLSINTEGLLIKDGAQASVSTVGPGNAGSLNVRAATVELTGTSQQSRNPNDIVGRSLLTTAVGEDSIGNGGNIRVQTDLLTISDGAALTASTSGQGNAGNIFIPEANLVSLSSNGLISTAVNAQAEGEGGNIDINTNTLSVNQGGQITASTLGKGNAGTVMIDARDAVSLDGVGTNGFSSGVFTSTGSEANGSGGAISVKTNSFSLANGAVVNAQTSNSQTGGNVTIEAKTFEANNGGQVITTTRSSGNAGDITLKVTEGINISGSDRTFAERIAQFGDDIITNQGATSGLFANTSLNSTAQGGNLTINTPLLRVQDGATISVSSPQGQAGNLDITAKTIRLNQGSLTAETAITRSQPGANIRLQGVDLLLMQNNSRISARANGTATGGNIIIDASKGFVIAPFGEDSDIIASASRGRGGNITINTQGLFGFFEGRAIRGNGTNDIDASSEFNNPGTVNINTLDIDPRRGLLQLPTVVVDVSRLVASNCGAIAGKDGSSFTYTGRGGLPDSPDDPLTSDVVWSDTRLTNVRSGENISAFTSKPKKQTTEGIAIIPATGWVFNNKGEVTLIASQSQTANRIDTPTSCTTN